MQRVLCVCLAADCTFCVRRAQTLCEVTRMQGALNMISVVVFALLMSLFWKWMQTRIEVIDEVGVSGPMH